VLDDGDGRLIEFSDQLKCRVGIVQIVIGELLATPGRLSAVL
jgi:hypothetical protein